MPQQIENQTEQWMNSMTSASFVEATIPTRARAHLMNDFTVFAIVLRWKLFLYAFRAMKTKWNVDKNRGVHKRRSNNVYLVLAMRPRSLSTFFFRSLSLSLALPARLLQWDSLHFYVCWFASWQKRARVQRQPMNSLVENVPPMAARSETETSKTKIDEYWAWLNRR